MSRPAHYVSVGQHAYYFNNGKLINGTETLTDIGNFGWAYPQEARNNGKTTVFPDSIVVDYGGLNDKLQTIMYRGGMSLPIKEIEELFRKGYIEEGQRKEFKHIIVGMAPGGRICVWVDHIEIKRGTVPERKKSRDFPSIVFGDSLEINNYLKHHPVDYSVWEQPDPRYELDFGFCSEDGGYTPVFMDIFSKEGVTNLFMRNRITVTDWNALFGKPSSLRSGNFYITKNEINDTTFKLQLPVHIIFSWQTADKEKIYCTDIVLPKDFQERFTKPYINPDTDKKSNYNRLVFGVEKDGEHCIIWLDGPGKQEKLMRFKGHIAKRNESNGIKSGGYATEVVYYE